MFVGEPAWHGLGVVLKDPPSIEEGIRMAGLDWNVRLEELKLNDGRVVPNRASVRESDGRILGVVGPSFVPLQNSEAFAWFQPMVDSKEVTLEAAGSLRDGQRVWVLGKVAGGSADIVKGDEVRQHILLAHGHDGSLAIRVGFTTVRVVCANTLSAAMDDKDSLLLKIHHREHAKKALEKVREVLDLARRDFAATADQLRELAKVGCDEVTLRRYVREVFVPDAGEGDLGAGKITIAKVVRLFHEGRGSDLPGVRGTMWGAYNAVTEFTTHERGKTADGRVDSQWFGEGAKLARRALNVGLELARAA